MMALHELNITRLGFVPVCHDTTNPTFPDFLSGLLPWKPTSAKLGQYKQNMTKMDVEGK